MSFYDLNESCCYVSTYLTSQRTGILQSLVNLALLQVILWSLSFHLLVKLLLVLQLLGRDTWESQCEWCLLVRIKPVEDLQTPSNWKYRKNDIMLFLIVYKKGQVAHIPDSLCKYTVYRMLHPLLYKNSNCTTVQVFYKCFLSCIHSLEVCMSVFTSVVWFQIWEENLKFCILVSDFKPNSFCLITNNSVCNVLHIIRAVRTCRVKFKDSLSRQHPQLL